MNRIEARGVSKTYGHMNKTVALRAASLRVNSGEIVSLIGPNGAGKSTLIKLIANLEKSTEGSIRVTGRVGYVPEFPAFYEALTAKEHLSLINESRENNPATESTFLDLVKLDDSNKKVSQFSKGMKRRLNIAMALSTNPDIMLLDEPFEGLDPDITDELANMVLRFKKEGIAVLLTSHELSLVDKVSDRLVFIKDGVTVEQNLKEYRYYSIQINGSNEPPGSYNFEEVEVLSVDQNSIHIKCSEEYISKYLGFLVTSGVKVKEVRDESSRNLFK